MRNQNNNNKNNNEGAARGGENGKESGTARREEEDGQRNEAARGNDDEEVTEPGERKRGGAVKLTDRDKDLLGLLVLARYMTAQQVHRLCFEGRHESLAYRRLLKLAEGDGGPPFIRQRFFRAYDGTRVAVWAPTPYGFTAAALRVGGLPELPRHDVGAQFLEHTIQLNELLVALWRTGDRRAARAAHPSFRWLPSDAVRLTFNEYVIGDVLRNRHQRRIIQPDALLELPAQRRRYFLECEMGGHTISPGPSAPPGATLSKAKRYNEYLTRWGDVHATRTHYALQYADEFRPEVLFLVRSTGRASSINSALAHWREAEQILWQRFADFRALTFDEAAAELRGLVGLPTGNVAAGPKPTTPGAYTVTREELLIVARFFRDSVASIHRGRDAFRTLGRQDLPAYPESASALMGFMERLIPGSTQ